MKSILTGILLVFLLLASCKKLDRYTQFNLSYDETVVVPSSTGINLPFNLISPDVTTNSESQFEVNDTRKDLIETIKLESLTLTVDSPAGEDFSFLKSIRIYLSADSLVEIKVAWNENVTPAAQSPLTLSVADTDLKEYIKKDKFKLRLETVTDEILLSDYHIGIHSTFFVDAKILGQ